MADVVRLQERLARLPQRAKVWHEAPASVLLFTGVRYERLTPAMIAAKANVAKTIDSLTALSRQLRQEQITSELIELSSGIGET